MAKPRLRFTGRDALVALLGASSLLLFSHIYALRPSLFLLPSPNHPSPPPPPTPPEGFTLGPPTADAPPNRMWVTTPGSGPRGVSPTTLLSHAPGWTVFTNLYLSNGTFFLVTPPEEDGEAYWPERRMITSTGLPGWHTNIPEREPTEREMDVMGFEEARARWGERVWDVEGFSILVNDPDQFLKHYYHVAAELLFGTERMLTNFDPAGTTVEGHVVSPVPDRIVFMQCSEEGFTDGPKFNQFFFPAMWPSTTPMFKSTYDQFATLVSSPHKAFRFPAALFIDRSAAFRGTPTGSTARTPAGPWQVGGGEFGTGGQGRNAFWWESARRRVGAFAGVPQNVLDLGVRAFGKGGEEREGDVPVIMYISRQNARRRLIQEDHEKLVLALEQMCRKHGWILDVVQMETLSREEQLRRAARTVVLIGVHGNGLTHQLLMPPHPYSTVIELFFPGGFARDYEWTAGVLGKFYVGVNNDTTFSPPDLPRVDYPEGFQGNAIPVFAPTVVRAVEQRMDGPGGPGHWQGFPGVGY